MPVFLSWQVPDGEGLDLVWASPGRRRQGLSAVGEMRYGISSRALLGTAGQPHQDLKNRVVGLLVVILACVDSCLLIVVVCLVELAVSLSCAFEVLCYSKF